MSKRLHRVRHRLVPRPTWYAPSGRGIWSWRRGSRLNATPHDGPAHFPCSIARYGWLGAGARPGVRPNARYGLSPRGRGFMAIGAFMAAK